MSKRNRYSGIVIVMYQGWYSFSVLAYWVVRLLLGLNGSRTRQVYWIDMIFFIKISSVELITNMTNVGKYTTYIDFVILLWATSSAYLQAITTKYPVTPPPISAVSIIIFKQLWIFQQAFWRIFIHHSLCLKIDDESR